MTTWLRAIVLLAGVAVLLGIGRGVLRTAVVPRLSGAAVRLLARSMNHRRGHPPSRIWRFAVVPVVISTTVLLPMLILGVGVVIGTALLAVAVGVANADLTAAAYVLGTTGEARPRTVGVAVATWAMLALLGAVLAARLACMASAYQRREQFVRTFAVQARSCLDAEDLLAAHLCRGGAEQFEGVLARWQVWLAETRLSHTRQPELLLMPSAPGLSWLDATMVIMDVAALAVAAAPAAVQPRASALLGAGCSFVQCLAAQFGLHPVETMPSLQGREERSVADSLARLADAGIRPDWGFPIASAIFHGCRVGYAPYTAALSPLLRAGTPDVERALGFEQAPTPRPHGRVAGSH